MQTLSTFDQALKIDYLPRIREQLNLETILMNKIVRNERDVSGKQWQLTAHYQRNSGIGARADNGTLPAATQQKYLNPSGVVAYNYGRISVTGRLIKLGPLSEKSLGKITSLNSVNILPFSRTIPSEPTLQLGV